MAILGGLIKFYDCDSAGVPLVGGQLFIYSPGTTTKVDTYKDSTEQIKNTNPVLLNARGEADVWIDGVVRMLLKDKDGNTLWDVDNISINGSSDATVFYDTNGFPVFSINTVGVLAKNYVTITNAAAGNNPALSVNGGDTNIDLDIESTNSDTHIVDEHCNTAHMYVSGDIYDSDDTKVVGLGGFGNALVVTSGSSVATISQTGTLTVPSSAIVSQSTAQDIEITGSLDYQFNPTLTYSDSEGSKLNLYDATTGDEILQWKAPDSLSGDFTMILPSESPTNTYYLYVSDYTAGVVTLSYGDAATLLTIPTATTTTSGGVSWAIAREAESVADEFEVTAWAALTTSPSPGTIEDSHGISSVNESSGVYTFNFSGDADSATSTLLHGLYSSGSAEYTSWTINPGTHDISTGANQAHTMAFFIGG